MSTLVERMLPARLGAGFRWLLGSSWTTNLGDGIAVAAGPLLLASLTDDPLLIALAALMLGMAYVRTRSLALPFGLHLGWNWMQGHVLGFDVSGVDLTGWFLPQLLDRPEWMTGGAFGPESTVFAVVVDLGVLLLLWKWKGTAAVAPRPRPVLLPRAA